MRVLERFACSALLGATIAMGSVALNPVAAAPLGAIKATTGQGVEQVDWRGYRNCVWRNGERVCYDRRADRRRYYGYYGDRYYRPGLRLYFGFNDYGYRHGHRYWR